MESARVVALPHTPGPRRESQLLPDHPRQSHRHAEHQPDEEEQPWVAAETALGAFARDEREDTLLQLRDGFVHAGFPQTATA